MVDVAVALPESRPEDDEDVVWGLSTASALWSRGERRDAIVWLRRAADAASSVGQGFRASEIGLCATALEELLEQGVALPAPRPLTRPPPPVTSASTPPPAPVRPPAPASLFNEPTLPSADGLRLPPPGVPAALLAQAKSERATVDVELDETPAPPPPVRLIPPPPLAPTFSGPALTPAPSAAVPRAPGTSSVIPPPPPIPAAPPVPGASWPPPPVTTTPSQRPPPVAAPPVAAPPVAAPPVAATAPPAAAPQAPALPIAAAQMPAVQVAAAQVAPPAAPPTPSYRPPPPPLPAAATSSEPGRSVPPISRGGGAPTTRKPQPRAPILDPWADEPTQPPSRVNESVRITQIAGGDEVILARRKRTNTRNSEDEDDVVTSAGSLESMLGRKLGQAAPPASRKPTIPDGLPGHLAQAAPAVPSKAPPPVPSSAPRGAPPPLPAAAITPSVAPPPPPAASLAPAAASAAPPAPPATASPAPPTALPAAAPAPATPQASAAQPATNGQATPLAATSKAAPSVPPAAAAEPAQPPAPAGAASVPAPRPARPPLPAKAAAVPQPPRPVPSKAPPPPAAATPAPSASAAPPAPAAPAAPAPAESAAAPAPAAPAPAAPAPAAPAEPACLGDVPLEDVDPLGDLPPEVQAQLVALAATQQLPAEQALSGFGVALLLEGEAVIAAVGSSAPASRAVRGTLIPTEGSIQDAAPIRLIAGPDGATVACWDHGALEEALKSCPWVLDEITERAERLNALCGATLGPLGDIDEISRNQLLDQLEVRIARPDQPVAAPGEALNGVALVCGGAIELLDENGAPWKRLGPGELLFPRAVLEGRPAPCPARAGAGGALILVGQQGLAQALIQESPELASFLSRTDD